MTKSVTTRQQSHFNGHSICARLFLNEPPGPSDTSSVGRGQCPVCLRTLLWILALLFATEYLFAQSRSAPDEQRAVDASGASQTPKATPRTIRVAGWTVSGSLRLRFEDWDFFKAQSGDNSYSYGASLLRVSVGRQFHSQDW